MSQQSENQETVSAPTTPGKAEGNENPDNQSRPSPAPTQPDQAEGEDKPDKP